MTIHFIGDVVPLVAMDVKIGIEQKGIVSIAIPFWILRLLKIKHLRIPVSVLGKKNVKKTVGSFPLIIPEWSHINVWQSTMSNVHRYAETIKGLGDFVFPQLIWFCHQHKLDSIPIEETSEWSVLFLSVHIGS
jgi:hypothetical protein